MVTCSPEKQSLIIFKSQCHNEQKYNSGTEGDEQICVALSGRVSMDNLLQENKPVCAYSERRTAR